MSAPARRVARCVSPLAAAALLFASLCTFSPSAAQAYDDPGVSYETIVTPHFEVHYQSQLEALAKRTALLCEESYAVLVPLLAWTPAARTQVFINDRLDTANGSATTYARNTINIFGMPPESESVLGYYDDWLRILVYHEYVHILHLDTTLGLSPYINTVLGKLSNPNQLLPRWYIEGLAVYHESARTGTGRVNSSLYRMWLRAEMLRNDPADLAQVSSGVVRWPFGSLAYLFGGFFVDWIARRHGEAFFTEFHRLYGARLIPYGINRIAREVAGEDFDEMWQQWRAEEQAKARALAVGVRARGMETRLEFLTEEGGEQKFVRWRPGHEAVTFFRDTLKSHPRFAELSVAAEQGDADFKRASPRKLFEVDASGGSANWFPDGERLIYARKQITANVYQYEDLYVWEASTGRETRLTELERGREPAVSPDGQRVVYVRNRFGTMELVLREVSVGERGELELGEARVLVSGQQWPWDDERHWQQIATPEFLPDGSGVVFSWWRLDLRQRDLWLYRFAETPKEEPSLEALMRDEAVDIDPSFGPDNRLYFASDRTGIYNIHAMDLETRQVERLTDVTLGVFTPRLSPDGEFIYLVTYTARGYDIARARHPKAKAISGEENTRAKAWKRYPAIDVTTFEERDYEPLRLLKPLTFIPDVAVVLAGVGLSASVTGGEPTARHAYTLSAGVLRSPRFGRTAPNLSASYLFAGAAFTLGLNAAYREYPNLRGMFAESDRFPFVERQSLGQVTFSRPFFSTFDDITLSASYAVDHRDDAYVPPIRHEPGDLEPRMAELGWFNQLVFTASYALLERYGYSISTERGVLLSASASARHPSLGSDYRTLGLNYSAQGFLPIPWLEQHVLSATVAGGLLRSNFRDQAFYSMGGNSLQNVFQSAVFQGGSNTLVVRGYPVNVQQGSKYLVSSLQWRFPLLDLEHGFSTTPLYFRRLKGRAFLDYGSAYSGYLADVEPLVGAGGELIVTAVFGYYLGGDLRLGYARGLTGDQGVHDLYLLYGGGF